MTKKEAEALDSSTPANILFKPGSNLVSLTDQVTDLTAGTPRAIEVTVNEDPLTTAFEFVAPVSMKLRDMIVRSTATQASGTIRLRRVTTVMGPTVTSAVIDNVTRAASLVGAQSVITEGETLNLLGSHTTVRCVVTLIGVQ